MKIATNCKGTLWIPSPTAAKSMIPISAIFTPTMTRFLLKRSASQPPSIENRMKGAAKSAPANATREACCSAERGCASNRRMTKFLSALSLNAFWNCVAIRLQNPLCNVAESDSDGVTGSEETCMSKAYERRKKDAGKKSGDIFCKVLFSSRKY